jgi:hypothetical protein
MGRRSFPVYHRHVEERVAPLNLALLVVIMLVGAVVVATVLATVPK